MDESSKTVFQEELSGYYDVLNALSTGTYKKSGDIIDYTLWDRFTLDSTVSRHTLFQNGRGTVLSSGASRVLADTSVEGKDPVPQGSKLYVRAILVQFQAKAALTEATFQNVEEMLQETTINIKIRGKDTQGEWALDEIMGRAFSGVIVPAAAGSNVGLPSVARGVGVKILNIPIVIAAQVHMEGQIEHWTAPNAAIDDNKVKIGLAGILERLS